MLVATLHLFTLTTAQTPRFREGDHWSLDRTIRFISVANDIDLQNDDHFEFRILRTDGKLSLQVNRIQTGTHLPGGVFVPSPPKGEPEVWKIPISADGKLTLDRQPRDLLERLLAEILVAALNGEAPPEGHGLITVKPLTPDREHVTYDGTPIQSPAKLEGDITFDPVSRAPILISLRGDNVSIPGGDVRASVKVQYRVAH